MPTVVNFQDHVVELPSLGKAYPDEIKAQLLQGTSLRVKNFVMGEKRAMKRAMQADPYEMYCALLDLLIVEPKGLPVDQLLISDILTILYVVHIPSFGPVYPIVFTCPGCKETQDYQFDISKLLIKSADEFKTYQADALEFVLPESGVKLTCHLPRLGDEKIVARLLADYRRLKKLVDEDFDSDIFRKLVKIDSIDGDQRITDTGKFEIMMGWSETDHEDLDNFLDGKDSGPVFDQIQTKCTSMKCRRDITLALPAPGPQFFRPKRRTPTV